MAADLPHAITDSPANAAPSQDSLSTPDNPPPINLDGVKGKRKNKQTNPVEPQQK